MHQSMLFIFHIFTLKIRNYRPIRRSNLIWEEAVVLADYRINKYIAIYDNISRISLSSSAVLRTVANLNATICRAAVVNWTFVKENIRNMSTDTQDTVNNDQIENEGRVVTDSIHDRFRQMYKIHCDNCNRDIPGNQAAIKKHFDDSHPSDRLCCYCKGKVFMYRKITTVDDEELSENFVYHKCKHNEQFAKNTENQRT